MRRVLSLLLAAALGGLLAGCEPSWTAASATEVAQREVRVVATTNFIADLAQEVGGRRVRVTGLMGPGVDPHLYKASAGDVRDLVEADLILYGGLELEGKMSDAFEDLAEQRPTVAVTSGIPRERLRAFPGHAGRFDPHVWFDPGLWRHAVDTTVAALVRVDPRHAEEYRRNGARHRRELAALDAWAARELARIPERRRVLVTSHDAFQYLGRRYDLDVVPIQGVSTATEASTADVERVAGVLADRRVPAVFVESSVPPQTIRAVLASAARRGHTARVGEELYADAAGARGTPEGTYLGMLRHNIGALVEGLR
jgi:manganese/zinc/iron transport system substrate-binding protein